MHRVYDHIISRSVVQPSISKDTSHTRRKGALVIAISQIDAHSLELKIGMDDICYSYLSTTTGISCD